MIMINRYFGRRVDAAKKEREGMKRKENKGCERGK
jgi:hypothetical protein